VLERLVDGVLAVVGEDDGVAQGGEHFVPEFAVDLGIEERVSGTNIRL
jgi:hypothetical protein